MQNQETDAIAEGIKYCFSKCVDERSLKIIYNMLEGMHMPESNIDTVILLIAATCAKHYKQGFISGKETSTKRI